MLEKVKMFIQKEILSTLKGDIIGGISVAFVALPLALSFGVLSGAGAAAGVYGAICTGILASMFGGTKAQISGAYWCNDSCAGKHGRQVWVGRVSRFYDFGRHLRNHYGIVEAG